MAISLLKLKKEIEDYSDNVLIKHPWEIHKADFVDSFKDICQVIYWHPEAILDLKPEFRDNETCISSLISIRDYLAKDYSYDIEKHYFIYKNIGLGSASDRIKNDKNFVGKVLFKNSGDFNLISENLKQDIEFVKKCLVEYKVNPSYIPEETILDAQFASNHLKEIPYLARYIDENQLNDKTFLLENIANSAYLLLHANDEIRNDFDLVLKLATKNKGTFPYIGDTLRDNPKFLKELLEATKANYFSINPLDHKVSDAFSNNLKSLIENTAIYHPWIMQDLPEFLEHVDLAQKSGLKINYDIELYKQLEYQNLSRELNNTKTQTKKMKL